MNPGPVDTGWPSDELRESLRDAFPAGRWGRPEDIAPIVAWLVSPDSAWMTGQLIDSLRAASAATFRAETDGKGYRWRSKATSRSPTSSSSSSRRFP